jgi:hypothetical protein
VSSIKTWFRRNASQLIWGPVGPQGATDPLTPNITYFRVTLCEMFLARDRDWFKSRYPAVQASVRLNLAGEEDAVTLSSLARPGNDVVGPGFFGNFPLTPLLPYRGGTVELDAALIALERQSGLTVAFELLRGFSGLIGPPLAQALTLAGEIAAGAEQLLGASEQQVELALHDSYVAAGSGENLLRPGYRALVRTTEQQLSRSDLCVEHDRLRIVHGGVTKPLEGHDYMLFRIDGMRERPDWRFPHFEQLRAKAISAHIEGNEQSFLGYRNTLLNDILTSPDLTDPDQIRGARALRDDFEALLAAGFGAVGDPELDLTAIVRQRAPSFEAARDTGTLTLEELLREDAAAT